MKMVKETYNELVHELFGLKKKLNTAVVVFDYKTKARIRVVFKNIDADLEKDGIEKALSLGIHRHIVSQVLLGMKKQKHFPNIKPISETKLTKEIVYMGVQFENTLENFYAHFHSMHFHCEAVLYKIIHNGESAWKVDVYNE